MNEPELKLDLAKAALEVRAASPARWDEFVKAFAAYSTHVRDRFLTEPADRLQNIQGQALACAVLTDLLRDAPRLVEQAQRRSKP